METKTNKLLELQKLLKPIKKDSQGYNYKYFDINALLTELKPHLNDLGLFLSQSIQVIDGVNVIVTEISDEGKVILESRILLPVQDDPQKFGSVITYYRRYALQSMLALEAEDDDAASVTKPKVQVAGGKVDKTGLVRFNPPYIADKTKFAALTTYLKENGGKFDADEKAWYVNQELKAKLEERFNNQ